MRPSGIEIHSKRLVNNSFLLRAPLPIFPTGVLKPGKIIRTTGRMIKFRWLVEVEYTRTRRQNHKIKDNWVRLRYLKNQEIAVPITAEMRKSREGQRLQEALVTITPSSTRFRR